MSSSAFVAGASGFIGEGVAKALRRAGFKVYGLIRDQKNSAKLIRNEIIPVVAKIEDVNAYADILATCSVIVDAVGWGPSAELFLKAANEAGRKKSNNFEFYKPLYIFTSGIMTYGTASKGPVDETTKPKPQFKDMQEREEFENKVLLTGKKEEAWVRPVMVRPGFVYGGNGGFVLDHFFNINKQNLVLHGRKDKRWSWVHVDDLGDAYALIATAGSIVDNQAFNLAAPGDNPTYEELRIAMATAAGWDPKTGAIEYRALPKPEEVKIPIEGEYLRWEADVIINPAKAVNLLGWKPRHIGFLHEVDLYYQSYKAHKQL